MKGDLPSYAYELYINFVIERHQIWERRREGHAAPWSDDPVLASRKFTNVFRILDHGTQYLLTNLLEVSSDPHEQLMRAFLYRYLNRPEPFIAYRAALGHHVTTAELNDGSALEFWRTYRDSGGSVFGNAYKMFVGAENRGTDRLTWAVNLTRDSFGTRKISDTFYKTQDPAERHVLLTTLPRCGDFMAMQIMTDVGYLDPSYDEDRFVVPGPGAKRGAKLALPNLTPAEAIQQAHVQLSRSGMVLLNGRPPSCMDVQNTLCEYQKYVRYLREPARTTPYRAAHPGKQPAPWVPPHWRLGDHQS